MKLEQGYGTLQENLQTMGYVIDNNGNKIIRNVNFIKGTRLYSVVELNDTTKKVSTSLRHNDGRMVRVSGNVFNKNNKVRLIK